MKFDLLRIKRLEEDIKKLIYKDTIDVNHFKVLDSKIEDGYLIETDSWNDFTVGENWKAKNAHRWFRTQVHLPESYQGSKVIFRIITGREGQWDACNPQFLFYVNGQMIQGCDVNHREVILTDSAISDQIIDIAFLAFGGSEGEDLLIKCQLLLLDVETEALYYDIKNPLEAAELIYDKDSYNRIILLNGLNKVADLIDLRQVYSKDYYASINDCRQMLKTLFYSKESDKQTVYAVGNTHIDIAWLWTVDQTREKVLRSYSTVIELMNRYPDYKFTGSQAILYQFVKEQAPELYNKIKEKVKSGQWEVDGGMWLEADCNIPSGESLIRQFEKGEEFFESEFGVRSSTLWLPDVFGYSAALPQIMKQFDIPYFVTTKLAWNQYNQLPNDMFNWRGLDGSQVFTFMPTTCDYDKTLGNNISFTDTRNTTTYTGILGPNMTLGTYERFQNKDILEDTMMLYGYGDGGGGPTREMLENEKRLKYGLPGIPKIKTSFNRDYLNMVSKKLINEDEMPTWDGELYFEYHRGTLTSNASVKKWNRQLEHLVRRIEILTAINYVFKNKRVPKEEINKIWDTLLLNQFHDIIPGTCIQEVYDQTEVEYKEAFEIGEKVIQEAISLHASDTVRVFNDLPFINSDVVSYKTDDQNCISLKDSGKPVQYSYDGDLIFIADKVAPFSFKSFEFDDGIVSKFKAKEISSFDFSNEFYSVKINSQGQVVSLVESETGFQLIKNAANVLVAYDDRPANWDNWDIDKYYQKKPYRVNVDQPMRLIENGPVRWTIESSFVIGDSTLIQKIHFYKELARIDFSHKVDWQSNNMLLRAEFPTTIKQTKATYDIQFGSVERETTNNNSWDTAKFETCAHKWVDYGNNGVGLSLMSDCKYGYSVKQGMMGVSLIKSGTYPNDKADIGSHGYKYALYPHSKKWFDSHTVEEADKLNNSMLLVEPAYGKNVIVDPILSLLAGNVYISAITRSKRQKGLIVRLYENKNTFTKVKLHLDNRFLSCKEVNLREEILDDIELIDGEINLSLNPFEIKTLLIEL